MKIVCDACSSKYSIADEKVQGKVFKIRCKKCSNIIVVRGTGEEAAPAPAPAPAFDQKETRVYDYGGEGAAPGGDEAVWHIVVEQEQVGPLTVADVQARFAAGEIDAESYIWREGFSDWLPMSQVAEVAHVIAGAAPAVAAPPSSGADAVASMFGASGDDDAAPSNDVFAAKAAKVADERAREKAAPAAAPAAAAAAGGTAASMRGQRNENSVLFSLGNLTALAADTPRTAASSASSPASGAAAHGGSEGSGLIDIRSMASAYLGPSKAAAGPGKPRVGSADDLPVFSTAAFNEPAVFIPMAGARNDNKTIYVLLGAIGLLAVLAVVLVIVVLGKKTPAPTAVAVNDKGSDEIAPPTPVIAVDAGVAIEVAAPDAGAAVAPPDPVPRPPTGSNTPPTRTPPTRTPPTRTPPVTPPRVVETPPAGGKCKLDEMGCLLADPKPACCSIYDKPRRPPPTGTPPTPPTVDINLPESLTKADISAGLAKVQSGALACGAKSSAKGKVLVQIKVAGSGAVSSVTVKESPDPALGACVQAAVKKGTYAKTQTGGSFQFPYRF